MREVPARLFNVVEFMPDSKTSPATQGSNTATVLRTVANTSSASRETPNPRFERKSNGYVGLLST